MTRPPRQLDRGLLIVLVVDALTGLPRAFMPTRVDHPAVARET